MSKETSRVKAIAKIVGNLQHLTSVASTEGLFVKDPSTPLFHLVAWDEFTLDQLNLLKTGVRRGDDFTIGERRYLDATGALETVIGIAFASDELLPKYGLVMDATGTLRPIRK